jgi:putative ABC transport system ATP-binding protein
MNPLKIQVSQLTKTFENEELQTLALRGINLNIGTGDYVSISGQSGCGKSTLLSILGLLDAPTSGQYLLEGRDVSQLSLSEAAAIRCERLGFIFQSFNLIDELSVFDNVALPLRYHRQPLEGALLKERVAKCLDKVEMSHRAGHRPNQLSGGQQQRIAIARALVANPAILLVDEPTGNLDSKNGDAVMELLADLNNEGTTICLVTHDPRYANMANKQFHLVDGVMMDQPALRAAS